MKSNPPILTLIGAGPGDPDLITLKAIKALKQAKVVLYDALVNPELLKHAPDAVHIFVGKRKGKHAYSQHEINKLATQHAWATGNAVRLKGGDPFVFGRGLEEKHYAEAQGVRVHIVPGLSSSISVPTSAGISLTHRDTSDGFWVITGTKKDGTLSQDIALAAQSKSTVVILMGVGKLRKIVHLFQYYQQGHTPVAIIQNGTTEKEKIGIGTMNNIEQIAQREQLSSPAIIVIGEVVNASKKLRELALQVNYDYILN